MEFPGRKIRWTGDGLEYEAGEKHVQVLVREWSLECCREVSTPSVGSERKNPNAQGQELSKFDVEAPRSLACPLSNAGMLASV